MNSSELARAYIFCQLVHISTDTSTYCYSKTESSINSLPILFFLKRVSFEKTYLYKSDRNFVLEVLFSSLNSWVICQNSQSNLSQNNILMIRHFSTQLGSPPILWEAKNLTSPGPDKALIGRYYSYERHQTNICISNCLFLCPGHFHTTGHILE